MSDFQASLIVYVISIVIAYIGMRFHYWKEQDEHADLVALIVVLFPIINTLIGCVMFINIISYGFESYQKRLKEEYRHTMLDKIFGIKRKVS